MFNKIKESLTSKWLATIASIITIITFLQSIYLRIYSDGNNIKGIDPDIPATIATVLGIFLCCYGLQKILDVFAKIWLVLAVIITVMVMVVSVGTETRVRKIDFGERNNHCESPKVVRWPISADDGWEIDVTSIHVKPTTSEKSTYFGVKDKTKDGFYIEGNIANNGECIKILGKVVAKDARGSLHVSGTYKETRLQVRSYLSFF